LTRQDWDDVLATFGHPHYEIIPTLTVHDGDAEVRGYYHDTRVAFPNQNHEIIALRHSADAVTHANGRWFFAGYVACWPCPAGPIRVCSPHRQLCRVEIRSVTMASHPD